MRPIILKGSDRPVNDLLFNADGDLLFSATKDSTTPVTVWNSETGERMGTYDGHSGVVWSVSVDAKSKRLLTASGDSSVRLWGVETGHQIAIYPHNHPVRVVAFAQGDQRFLSVTDQVMGTVPTINIWSCASDMQVSSREPRPELKIDAPGGGLKILKALWGYQNGTILTGGSDGFLRIYETKHGKETATIKAHEKTITGIQMDKWGTTFITASKDGTAKLWDTRTLHCENVYEVGRPLNAASISPLMDHVIMGGGERAEDVTQTGATSEQFKVRFFHSIFATQLGSVAGHFGPINALSFSPDGRSFASGSEDGFIRLHHLDDDYFKRTEDLRFPGATI